MRTALFVHNNFPGQLGWLAEPLRARGWACHALAARTAPGAPGVTMHAYGVGRGSTPGLFAAATRAEADMIRGACVAERAVQLREAGLRPDVVIGHPGWGETLFLADVFPGTPQILYAEFYYRARGGDADFDPEFAARDLKADIMLHAKSATLALAYAHADVLVAPTAFQASMAPERLRRDIRVIHEGVDTDLLRPRTDAAFTLPDGRVLDRSTPVVTFVSRVLEPMRGFHVFVRALPELLARVPDAQVLVIGDPDGRGYGAAPPAGETWKSLFLGQAGGAVDLSRVHMLGRLPRAAYLDALSVSAAHVYLTWPFTLSWSLVEAMSLGCVVVASDTAPVRDAIRDGREGVLVDFFDPAALARAVARACLEPRAHLALREGARRAAVARFDRARVCLPAWIDLVETTAGAAALSPEIAPGAALPTSGRSA